MHTFRPQRLTSGAAIRPDGAWPADVDTNQIAQVVHNLVLNAMQAMPRGGVVDVSLQNVELTADTLPPIQDSRPGATCA